MPFKPHSSPPTPAAPPTCQATRQQQARQQQLARTDGDATRSSLSQAAWDERRWQQEEEGAEGIDRLPWQRRREGAGGSAVLLGSLAVWLLLVTMLLGLARLVAPGGVGMRAGISGVASKIKAKSSFIQRLDSLGGGSNSGSGAATPSSATSNASGASLRQSLLLHR